MVTRLEQLHPGAWVNDQQPLIQVVAPNDFKIEGFVSEQNLPLIADDQTGVFVADRGDIPAIAVDISSVDVSAVYELPYPELTSQHKGAIAIRPQPNGKLLPENAQYRVNFRLFNHNQPPVKQLPGVVVVKGKSRSLLWYQLKLLGAPLIRESGF